MLNSALAIIVILMFAFFLSSTAKLRPSITPLVSLAVLIDISIIFGMVNLLKPGVCAAYALAAVCFAFSVYKNRDSLKEKLSHFLEPGVVLFIVTSLAMMLFLFLRKPLMTEWDEFSFWGISQKLVKSHEALYTYYKSSMIGNSTPPTLAVLSFFFQPFTREFAEHASFLAYDVMFFSCFAALTSGFEKKDWNASFAVYLFGFLLPYVFEVYTRIIYLEPVYITTYADIPLGVMFAGSFAVYFFSKENNSRDILPILPVLMMFTMIKDMGFAISCIVLFCAFFDMLVSKKDFTFLKVKGFFAKCLSAFSMFFVTVLSFASWSFHMAKVMNRNSFELGGETNMGYVQMLTTGIRELLGIGDVSYKFATIKGYMLDALFGYKLSMLGTGAVLICIITALFLTAFVLNDKKGRIRTAVLYVTSVIGFVGYYIFHLFLYVYIFKDNGYSLVSYNRYIYPYYMGWLAMAVMCLSLAVTNGKKLPSKAVIFAFVLAVFGLFTYYAPMQNIFIGCSDSQFSVRKSVKSKADAIKQYIGKDDVIYVYSGGDNGERWFMYTYELVPNIVVEETAVNVTDDMTADEIKRRYREYLYDLFVKNGVDGVLIDNSSPLFCDYYGDLFDTDMGHIGLNTVSYYKVNYENDRFYFTLVGEETVK
ncbi:MAG: hypothetical protein PUB11_05560 [Oscillospiraceae bacterium]|nr:hypothetical protein [Oscillospiraceae bacterium]